MGARYWATFLDRGTGTSDLDMAQKWAPRTGMWDLTAGISSFWGLSPNREEPRLSLTKMEEITLPA
jgi:hypothetical protein